MKHLHLYWHKQRKWCSMINTVVTPPCSITQLVAEVQVRCGQEGLIEPLNNTRTGILKYILVARTLARAGEKCKIILQVVNGSPTATTVYKGTKLGTFTPIGHVQLISNVQESHCETKARQTPLQIDLTTIELSQTEQRELLELLTHSVPSLWVMESR